MRQKSTLVWILVGLVLLGLAALNVALREDPEAELASSASRSNDAPHEDVVVAPELEEEGTEETALDEVANEAPAAPSEDARGPEVPVGTPGCEHPFVPSTVGDWRRYVWRQSGEERSAELRIDAIGVRDLPEGDREITWSMRVTATDDASELAREELVTRCNPGHDAEEPWFGILERSLGLTLTHDPERWRWPARLRAGDRFEGTAELDPTGAEMQAPPDVRGPAVLRITRRHVVGEREAIEVPAGRYRAWRVDYEEQQAFGPRGERGTGTIWVAPDAGMVKSRAENSEGIVSTIELVASGRRAR